MRTVIAGLGGSIPPVSSAAAIMLVPPMNSAPIAIA
jgi:hypothetical protein